MSDNGSSPAMANNCGNCAYSGPAARKDQLLCLRHPPTPLAVGEGTDLMGRRGTRLECFFPLVTPQNVCGEHPILRAQMAVLIETIMKRIDGPSLLAELLGREGGKIAKVN